MRYRIAFSRLKSDELRRLILGDDTHEPLTGVTYLKRWEWDAVRNIARETEEPMSRVLQDAVREYVLRRGYRRPVQVHDDEIRADAEAADNRRESLFPRLFNALHKGRH